MGPRLWRTLLALATLKASNRKRRIHRATSRRSSRHRQTLATVTCTFTTIGFLRQRTPRSNHQTQLSKTTGLLQKRLGTKRVVVVTPSTYGTDNRCMVDAVGRLGATARGIAVVDITVTDIELRELATAGVRGIRFNLTVGGVTTIEMVEPLARRIHDLGWHVQVNLAPDALVNNQDMLRRLPTPVVFDHMARIPLTGDVEQQAAFVAINRLIDRGNAWVKLSGAYLGSKVGPPTYADTQSLGRGLREDRAGAHRVGQRLAASNH